MKIRMLPYGRTFEAFKKAELNAKPCEAKVSDQTIAGARGHNTPLGAACGMLAKIEIDGAKLCYKHASILTLRDAIKRSTS